jgi:inorganic pyrophosphatase
VKKQAGTVMKRKTAAAAKRAAASKPLAISVTIETPRGSRNKIKYEPAKKMYSLSKILPEGMVFPYDFGFVPGTKAEDGDPLDVLVLTDEPLFPGCLVDSRLIGVIELTQEEGGKKERNDRLIAVAQASLLYADVKDLAGLNGVVLKQVEEFFVNYQRVRNIKVTVLGRHGPDRAREVLQRSRRKKG